MKCVRWLSAACAAGFLMAASVQAQVIVDETFDGYTDTFDMQNTWTPDMGDGASPVGLAGEIIPNADTTTYPFGINNPPGIMGQGVGNFGSVNEYAGSSYSVFPDENQNIVVAGDIYIFDDGEEFAENDPDDDTGGLSVGEPKHNTRQTIGLRNDTVDRELTFGIQRGVNFLEMGTWNASTCDPTVAGCVTGGSLTRAEREANPGFIAPTQFAYRMVLFSTYGDMIENGVNKGPMVTAPNWQYFKLNPALDTSTTPLPNGTVGNNDGDVDIHDVGSGWHRFEATLKDASIVIELDLFRDGIDNATGLAGPDASVEMFTGYGATQADPGNSEVPFTSLRIGGPSGVSSLTQDETQNHPGVFDNIYLAVEEITNGNPGDIDGDGDGDGDDIIAWQRDDGTLAGLQAVMAFYGQSSAAPAVAAVPEPASFALAFLAASSFLGLRTRSRAVSRG